MQLNPAITTQAYRLRAVEGHQFGRRILVGFMRASDLAGLYAAGILQIDQFGPTNPEGYQRTLSKTRSRRYGRWVGNGGISPNGILLFVRDPQANIEPQGAGVYSIDIA